LKECRGCRIKKNTCEFRYSPISRSGLTTRCIECLRKEALVFESKAKVRHGGKYKYNTLDDYSGDRIIVQIYCTVHDITFPQRPFAHMKGQGCPVCGQESRVITSTKTTEQFITDSIEVHGNLYDYSNVDYQGAFCDVTIFCNKEGHGDFKVLANNHLCGYGCKLCAKEDRTSDNEEKFIRNSKDTYGEDSFDYSKVNYINNTTKIEMKCNLHEEWFKVTPMFHSDPMKNSGCKYCGKMSSNRWTIKSIMKIPNIENKYGYIYSGTVDTLPSDYIKIGITADLVSRQNCYKRDLKTNGVFSYMNSNKYRYLHCARVEAALKVFLRPYHTKSIINFGGKNEVFCLKPNMLSFVTDIIMGVFDDRLYPHLNLIVDNKVDSSFMSQLYEEVKHNYV
jgi:hypothetical protein